MNYRHSFHAGNFADVVKHVVLTLLVGRLAEKAAAFRVIDTHAGRGLYDLADEAAARTGEWRGGVARLQAAVPQLQPDLAALVAPWAAAVAAVQAAGAEAPAGEEGLRYPGSPLFALYGMRADDRLIACEKQPDEAALLAETLAGERRAKAIEIDGYQALKAFLPPPERRGLVLVDPPYEAPGEREAVVAALAAAVRRWPQGVFALWYPVVGEAETDRLRTGLKRIGAAPTLALEVRVRSGGPGLYGCGMAILNAPWRFEAALRPLAPLFARVLGEAGPGSGRADVHELVPEK